MTKCRVGFATVDKPSVLLAIPLNMLAYGHLVQHQQANNFLPHLVFQPELLLSRQS